MLSAKLSEKSQNNVAFATTLKPSEEGRVEGRIEGREEEKRAIAQRMAKNGFTLEQIAVLIDADLAAVESWLSTNE